MLFNLLRSNFPPLTIAFALAAVVSLSGSRAQAGRAASSSDGFGQIRQSAVAPSQTDRMDSALDAERVFRDGAAQARSAAAPSDADGSTLSPLPDSGELDSDVTGELTGKSLSRVLSALPRVGSDASPATLLAFWDDASSARSALDDRATAAGELSSAAVQGAGHTGAQSNVMIPLPMAGWSGFSVLGGLGLFAGLRRIIQRGH